MRFTCGLRWYLATIKGLGEVIERVKISKVRGVGSLFYGFVGVWGWLCGGGVSISGSGESKSVIRDFD